MIGDRLKLYGALGAFLLSAAGATYMAFGKHAAISERDVTTGWADRVCISIGQRYTPEDGKGARSKWGHGCAELIAEYARRINNAATATSDTLVDHTTQQATKAATDAGAARRSAARTHSAEQKLETAHAAAQDGEFGPDWFDGLSDAFGLRGPATASPPAQPAAGEAPGGGPEGTAVVGSFSLR